MPGEGRGVLDMAREKVIYCGDPERKMKPTIGHVPLCKMNEYFISARRYC